MQNITARMTQTPKKQNFIILHEKKALQLDTAHRRVILVTIKLSQQLTGSLQMCAPLHIPPPPLLYYFAQH